MTTAIQLKTRVQPGGRIEITDPTLPEGEEVEVIVTRAPAQQPLHKQSMLEFLNSLPPDRPRCFTTPEEADRFIQEERDAWDR